MNVIKADKNASTVGGLRAIELYFRAIDGIPDGVPAAYQTQMRLNAPSMGILFPDDYEKFIELHPDRASELYSLAVVQIGDAIEYMEERDIEFDWISLYMPLSLLKKEDCKEVMLAALKKSKVQPSRICFELSEELLFETDSCAADAMEELTKEGFMFMMRNFGGDDSPVTRLAGFRPDYVILSSSLTKRAMQGERYEQSVKGIVRLASELGTKCIASDVENSEQGDKMAELGCKFCVGKYSGNFMQKKYIRKSNAVLDELAENSGNTENTENSSNEETEDETLQDNEAENVSQESAGADEND